MRYLILVIVMCSSIAQAQTPYPTLIIDNSQPWHNGNINITNVDNVIYYNAASNNAKVEITASHEILLQPNAIAANFNNNGSFHAVLRTNSLDIVSFHPNGWVNIPKYDKFEIGIKIPPAIQSQIDAFLNGGTGINPYDPDQIKIECIYNSGAYKRYGFYYRDFTVQNNEWVENFNDYKFRVRIAPPQVGSNMAVINLIVNGIIVETITRFFEVIDNGNPGHLKMAAGNLRKLQFTNGDPYYALGQNIGYPLPSQQNNCDSGPNDCYSAFSFQKQRDYIADLANNGGNFVRLRLDALTGLAEWPYLKRTVNDPPVPSKPLSSYLNNYNDNQRYLWEMDKTFSLMEGDDIYCMLNILPDQNFSVDGAYDCGHNMTWNNNPYNTITGNDVAGCKAFFSNPQSIETYRKWLYYIMARYGYSTRLGIWEMINETSGVGNSYSSFTDCSNYVIYSPYENETSFANDVNNWTCDMKYYLEQFYPWHPTTSGNTGAAQLPFPNCLNIWSSNNYTGFIQNDSRYFGYGKYSDSNKGRFATSRFFENNYRPFIFGELGLGDGMNFVDKYNDREFHNTLWSTSMGGGIGAGLYWNDWEQSGGVNHRANFNAIHDFFTYHSDLSQPMSAQFADDENGPIEIHTYSMVRWDKKYIIGWAQNNSSNWTVDYQNLPIVYNQQGDETCSPSLALSESGFNGAIDQYAIFSSSQSPYIKVDNVKKTTRYRIQIYDAYNGANLLETKFEYSDLAGALTFRRFMPNLPANPFYPDYVFTAQHDPVFRVGHTSSNSSSDTLDITEADTLCLSPDFIVDNISNYRYNWNLGNGTVTQDSTPCTHYKKEGTYNIEVIATNLNNDSVVRFSKELVVIKKYLNRNDNVTVSPNPASNKIYLSYDKSALINPIIKLIDILGKETEIILGVNNSFNVESVESGIYFIKFTTTDYEQVIKISIQH